MVEARVEVAILEAAVPRKRVHGAVAAMVGIGIRVRVMVMATTMVIPIPANSLLHLRLVLQQPHRHHRVVL
jgi:hypothetical protein